VLSLNDQVASQEAAIAAMHNNVTTATLSAQTVNINGTTLSTQNNTLSLTNSNNQNLLSLDQNGNATISGTLTTNAGSFDVAEDYPTKDQTIAPGDVLSVDQNNSGEVQKTTTSYDHTIIGVYSTKPGFRLSENNGTIKGDKAVPVALTGRVPVKVDLEGGAIHEGDYLTSSSTPGVAMKATKPGQVLGKALEDFSCTAPGITSPVSGQCMGTIDVFVNVTFADPNNVLSNIQVGSDGKLLISTVDTTNVTIPAGLKINGKAITGTLTDALNALSTGVTNNTSSINALTDQMHETSSNVTTIFAQIAHINTVLDQLLSFAQSFHDQVNNTASQITTLNNKVDNLNNASSSADTNFEASTSAALQSQGNAISGLQTQIASLSGKSLQEPQVPTASSEGIFALSTLSDKISDLEKEILSVNMSNELSSQDATISGSLTVFGKTTISDLGVTGNITAGVMTINGLDAQGQASINTVGDLKLQDQGAGGIDILSGKIKIDTNGNFVSKAEVTAKKFNVDTSDVLSASLGTLTIKAGQTQAVATTSALTKNSKIFATPIDTPVAVSTSQADNDTLLIKLAKPSTKDIKVNWWIVN
jgi:hypothetical protein